ncbi:uncharacterized protein METZ01_LOCUS419868 [marine metagenome]|uniref:Uncharacterized protein n=1 Tax=marine metagenome TaxID=408172 RepID=A0A382X810_9ZZZZ
MVIVLTSSRALWLLGTWRLLPPPAVPAETVILAALADESLAMASPAASSGLTTGFSLP